MEATNVNSNLSPSPNQSSSNGSFGSENSKKSFIIDTTPNGNGKMPDQHNPGISTWQSVEYVINMVNHVLIGFVTIYLSWMCLRGSMTATAWHAWLVTLGFNCLMAEGVMTHYNGNTFLFFYKRKTKTTIHWVLQALGGTLGIVGCIIKIANKTTHFTTIHSKLGLAAMILCALSMISGLSALYSQSLRRVLQPLLNKSFHNFVGVAALVIGLVAQYYGYETGFFSRRVDSDFKITMEVFTLMTLVLCCWGPLRSLWWKLSNIRQTF